MFSVISAQDTIHVIFKTHLDIGFTDFPQLLDFNDKVPDLNRGWHFNLYNNKWGTNFPTWYDDDALFRFEIIFDN